MTINIIVGPPCAGKSSYAKKESAEGDVIIDYDLIAAALGSRTSHGAEGSVRRTAFAARDASINRVLKGLDDSSWIIHTRPSQRFLDLYKEVDVRFTLIDPGKDECLARAKADGRPSDVLAAIEDWYQNPPSLPMSKGIKKMNNRAYSILSIKSIDEGRRVVSGIATTPTVDRVGDIIDPLGVKFSNPLAFLWQHRHDQPIGSVKFDKPTKSGIMFEAEIAKTDEPGTLKDRLDEAWQSIKMGLVRAVSIGFRPLEYAFMENGGIRYSETEVYELSAVTIPANSDALITTVKSIDAALRKEAGIPDPEVPNRGNVVLGRSSLAALSSGIGNIGIGDLLQHVKIPLAPEPAAIGKSARVVKLDAPARDRAKPFVIREIKRT